MRLKDVKVKVIRILAEFPNARNNDGTLIAFYLAKNCPKLITFIQDAETGEEVKTIMLKNFKHLPSFESIRRSRQIIQNNEHLYLPTDPKVRKARKIKEANYRNWEVREAQKTNAEPSAV